MVDVAADGRPAMSSAPSLPPVPEDRPIESDRAGGKQQPRLVLRNLPFQQSRNRVYVRHNQGFKIFMLLKHDWFHVLLRFPIWQSLPFLLAIWTLMIILFAGIYVWVDNGTIENCGLGADGATIGFGPAFAFSLETCTTGKYPNLWLTNQ